MGATSFHDLEAWRLADDLRREVLAFTNRPPVAGDRSFCTHIRETSSSVCRNLAEGFGRRQPTQFLPFVVIALGSLAEVQDQLLDATERRYLADADYTRLRHLSERTRQTTDGLRRYLTRCVRRRQRRKPNGTPRTA